MKKKIIILLLIIFLTCGCSSTINITINEDDIAEEINVNYFVDDNTTKEMIPTFFRDYIPAFGDVIVPDTEPDEKLSGIAYYNKKITDIGSGYSFRYNYNYKINNYQNARSVKKAFRSFNILKDTKENTITISTDNQGIMLFDLYDNLNELTINIKTTNQVLETNGTKNGDTYTWEFNRNSYNKNIYLVMKQKSSQQGEEPKPNSNINNTNNDNNEEETFLINNPVLIVFLGIIIILIVLVIANKIKNIKYRDK